LNIGLLDSVIALAVEAGTAILEVYERQSINVHHKQDESPLTEADMAAHKTLQAGLELLLEGVPVLSEESKTPSFSVRKNWQKYWIIDPLDGTKEFISRNGEFTVNIALVDRHAPVLGVVHVPVSGITYAGTTELGAFRQDQGGRRTPIEVRTMNGRGGQDNPVTVVASRRHGAGAVNDLLQKMADEFELIETSNMGSSLKLCLVAEGSADLYPRLAPTMEWDTAAAQAVVEAAGGVVRNAEFEPLRYNTKDDLRNPHFYVLGDANYPWRNLLT
jgi:3'(2'), 5'-bisphosphate nucleotidase